MAQPLVIDGSTLEGGGQVIRTALSLAWVQKSRPLRLHSIRAGRPKPGLANQHLMGARLAAQLLPARGFMEQSVQELLERGLVELCALKPKYPTLNTKESALKFLAVYLKAHNPTTKAKHLKHKYGGKLHDFTESCTLADRLLAAKKGSVESQAAGATELERLAALWDDCRARDLADFLK